MQGGLVARKVSVRLSVCLSVPKPPREGLKTQNGRFQCKIALRLKKVCYKVSLYENCQGQSCKAFISNEPKMNIVRCP